MTYKSAILGAVIAVALAAAPISPASAHGYRGGGVIFGLAALGTAAVVGAAEIATAPIRALAGPPVYVPAPAYYAPAPSYYYVPAPRYYYAPAPAYYAVPRGYYYAR